MMICLDCRSCVFGLAFNAFNESSRSAVLFALAQTLLVGAGLC